MLVASINEWMEFDGCGNTLDVAINSMDVTIRCDGKTQRSLHGAVSTYGKVSELV